MYLELTKVNEGNLKDISLKIPKNKFVVITGVSGSGKSTLAIDVIYQECQRQYLEAMSYQGIQKPDAQKITGVSPAIHIMQKESNTNPRSTVGTVTNIYTQLRMIYDKLGVRTCPDCKKTISAGDCKEEVVKKDGEFTVFMYCNLCNHRIKKITRSDFSYNTKEGSCKTCEGMGDVLTIVPKNVYDEELTLEEGAVSFWNQSYKDYQISVFYNTLKYYNQESVEGIKVKDYNNNQKTLLLFGVDSLESKELFPDITPPKTVAKGKLEGILTVLYRRLADYGTDHPIVTEYFSKELCKECGGERLNEISRNVTVNGIRLPMLSGYSLENLYSWVKTLTKNLSKNHLELVKPYLLDIEAKIRRIVAVGLGYLTLDRQTMTLSGGESQRIRLSAVLDSLITGVIFIMDEPTVGLHPKDTKGMIKILKDLRDIGNTVIVIEHDPDIMKEADHIIDIGPLAGKHGGEVVAEGSYEEILKNKDSVTGRYLKKGVEILKDEKKNFEVAVSVKNADAFNLKNISVDFYKNAITAVTGVSGSGKSTLVFEVLAKGNKEKVFGLEDFKKTILIDQGSIHRSNRSNVATYIGAYTDIRDIFSSLESSKKMKLTSSSFSFNVKGGRCENCKGLGYVKSNMLFFSDIDVTCPACNGKQFKDKILSVLYKDLSIKDILKLDVGEALIIFKKNPKILKTLTLLDKVGLSYLELGQSLTTLSGGEGQRIKLARELLGGGSDNLYLFDEPTTGLHPFDIEKFQILLDEMINEGNTIIIVEHNQQIIKKADFTVDLGPEGGDKGGEIIYSGPTKGIMDSEKSYTGFYLKD